MAEPTPPPPGGALDTEIHDADTATVTIRCGGVEHVVEFAATATVGIDATLLVEGLSLHDAADGTYRPADGAAAGVVRLAGPVRLVQRRACRDEAAEVGDA